MYITDSNFVILVHVDAPSTNGSRTSAGTVIRDMTHSRLLWLSCDSVLTHLPLEQNGHHFADNIFLYIFLNGRFCIVLIKISLTFVPNCPIDNNPVLV